MDFDARIFVSTGGYKGMTADEACLQYRDTSIRRFELSACDYHPDLLPRLKKLAKSGWSFKLHNYFPPPAEPFVLNLASCRDDILERSIAHCKQAVDWCVELGSDVYGIHAGYLVDPKVSELGKKIKNREINDRTTATARFLDALKDVANYGKSKKVNFLVENNVLSQANFESFEKQNPLLLVDDVETAKLVQKFPDNVGLLIDVAHLKVSATTLGFDPKRFMDQTKERTLAYHLSDNDGTEDSNEGVRSDSYFFKLLKTSPEVLYYSLEVYGRSVEEMVAQKDLVIQKLARTNF